MLGVTLVTLALPSWQSLTSTVSLHGQGGEREELIERDLSGRLGKVWPRVHSWTSGCVHWGPLWATEWTVLVLGIRALRWTCSTAMASVDAVFYHDESNLGRKDLFSSQLQITVYHSTMLTCQGLHSQEQKERNVSMPAIQLTSSTLQDTNSGNGASHSGLGLPTSFDLIKSDPYRHARESD